MSLDNYPDDIRCQLDIIVADHIFVVPDHRQLPGGLGQPLLNDLFRFCAAAPDPPFQFFHAGRYNVNRNRLRNLFTHLPAAFDFDFQKNIFAFIPELFDTLERRAVIVADKFR